MWSSAAASAVVVSMCAALLTGCGTLRQEPGAEASSDELGRAFSQCDHSVDSMPDPIDELIREVEWLDVTAVLEAERTARGELSTLPAVVLVRDGGGVSERTVRIHTSFWPGVDWGLGHGARVWFQMADASWGEGMVYTVLVLTSHGAAFFPGGCQERIARAAVVRAVGERADEVLAALPTATPAEREVLLDAVPEAEPDLEPILNPADAAADLLESLDHVTFAIAASRDLEGRYVVCPKIAAGWNDCLMVDDDLLAGSTLTAYVDASRRLEFWLLDEHGDTLHPVALLGEVEMPERGRPAVLVTVPSRDELESRELGSLLSEHSGSVELVGQG